MTGFFEQMTSSLNLLNSSIPFAQMLGLAIRIFVAGVCGGLVGIERSRRFKEAGVRTHVVVACGAALMMIVSKYGFADLSNAAGDLLLGTKGADPSRIASQVVSGVSFLGAGVIFKNGTSIKGLTTAAGVWATAGIGLAIGCGMYFLGLFTTGMILLFQMFMHKHTIGTDFVTNEIDITVEESTEFQHLLKQQFREWHIQIVESNIKKKNGLVKYQLLVKVPKQIEFDEILDFMEENETIKSFETHGEY
ncbi:MAG: MgtC/SapB family protein [Lachnospiraceae bacterium]|nr:MgtC/SapB family protein [Lachnospiraceae bacterium]